MHEILGRKKLVSANTIHGQLGKNSSYEENFVYTHGYDWNQSHNSILQA